MDEATIRRVLDEVLQELNMPVGSARVEAAMGAPEGEAVQVRFTDESTGGKAVAVSLRDTDGRQLDEEGLKQRLREQISTFRKIDEM
jgi:predicted thioesterase